MEWFWRGRKEKYLYTIKCSKYEFKLKYLLYTVLYTPIIYTNYDNIIKKFDKCEKEIYGQ